MLRRQKATLPRGWFPDQSPTLDAVLSSFAYVASQAYSLLTYVKLQSRIKSASDGLLDLIAFDFFGLRFRRRKGQADDQFRTAILAEVFRDRVTRSGIKKAVEDLTGNEARIFEPFNATDCGGLDTGYLGFDTLGRFGAVDLPRQIFIATLNPQGAGIPDAAGFDSGWGGMDNGVGGVASGLDELGDVAKIVGPVTQQDIYDTINATRAAGITAWTAIGLPPEARLDVDFTLDVSELV